MRQSLNTLKTLQTFSELPDEAHVRLPVVAGLFAMSVSSVWRRVKDGSLPHPIKVSRRITAWRVSDLRRVLTEKAGAP